MEFMVMDDQRLIATRALEKNLQVTDVLDVCKVISKTSNFDINFNYLHDFRRVEEVEGGVLDYQNLADFAVSIASTNNANVVFIIADEALTLRKYIEGHILMASESNRHYWIFTDETKEQAFNLVGLKKSPFIDISR